MRGRSIIVGVLGLGVWAAPARAQSVARQVGSIEDGTVTMSLPAKAGVCGDGETFMARLSPTGSTSFWGTWNDRSLERCEAGPLQVVLSLRDSRIRTLEVFAGPDVGHGGTDLGDVDGQEAVDLLFDRIEEPDEDGVRSAFRAISLADGVQVADRLMSTAADRSHGDLVRERAVRAMVDPAEEEGVGGVRELLSGIASDRRDAPALRERAIRVLGEVRDGDTVLRGLYADLDRVDLRERTIRVVAETHAASNARWLQDIARDPDERVALRERAIRVLGDELHEVEALRDLYGSLDEIPLRERVIRVVAQDRGPEVDLWLRAIAEDVSEREMLRERAIRVLGEREDGDAVLRSLYARLDRPALKERTIRVVAEHETETNARWLEDIVRDRTESSALRERAIRVLGEDQRNADLVRDLYDELADTPLKERIIRVVSEDRSRDTDAWLGRIALNRSEPVTLRERALRILGDSRASSAELGELYDDLDNRALQDRVLRILGERDDDDAIDKIIDVAENETDRSLRDRAFRILGESANPKGRAYLIERVRG